MTPTNIEEFKKLVDRYETITIEEIENAAKRYSDEDFYLAKIDLTGFGNNNTCTLCQKSLDQDNDDRCIACVYAKDPIVFGLSRCFSGKNNKTYNAIKYSNYALELLLAFRNRAKHLRKHYAKYLK